MAIPREYLIRPLQFNFLFLIQKSMWAGGAQNKHSYKNTAHDLSAASNSLLVAVSLIAGPHSVVEASSSPWTI
jgi:hypothetical protein